MASRDLTLCCSLLRRAVPRIIGEYNAIDAQRKLEVICTLRSLWEQEAAYARGRTVAPIGPQYIVTKIDGLKVKGRHQAQERHGEVASHAVDFGVMVGAKYEGDNTKLYEPLMLIAESYGLRSGQDWDCDGQRDLGWKDFPHVECLGKEDSGGDPADGTKEES